MGKCGLHWCCLYFDVNYISPRGLPKRKTETHTQVTSSGPILTYKSSRADNRAEEHKVELKSWGGETEEERSRQQRRRGERKVEMKHMAWSKQKLSGIS